MRSALLLIVCSAALTACDRGAEPNPGAPHETATMPGIPSTQSANTASKPREPVYREFKDFVVGCDNTGACTAVGVQSETDTGMYLVLSRAAGSPGATSVVIASTGDNALKASNLAMDGKPSTVSSLAWKDDGEGTLSLGDDRAIASLLAALHNAKSIGSTSDKDSSVSLEGLNASLLFIDEQQGRVGTVTALSQSGSAAADQVPPAAPAPVIGFTAGISNDLTENQSSQLVSAVRAQAAAELKAADCDFEAGPEALGDADEAVAVTASEALVFITCNGGPYQSEVLAYRTPLDGKAATRLLLPPLAFKTGASEPTTFDTLVGADYDPKTATLSYLNKGRGIGDCGDQANWRFDGTDFTLASASSLERCAGVPPDYWPVFWRTSVTAP